MWCYRDVVRQCMRVHGTLSSVRRTAGLQPMAWHGSCAEGKRAFATLQAVFWPELGKLMAGMPCQAGPVAIMQSLVRCGEW